jgi:WD40-like Beta Propeller Repeat
MSQTDRLEHDLIDWFGATASSSSAIQVEDVLQLTAGTAQRPAWTFPQWWLPPAAITSGGRTIAPLPWRSLGLVAALAMLLGVALAVYVGSRPDPLPEPFGVARNGLVTYSERGEIFVVDPISGRRTIAVGGAGQDREPRFSRDGRRLAFMRGFVVGATTVYVADADGSNAQPIGTLPIAFAGYEWAPDGRSLLINPTDRATGAGSIGLLSTDGSGHVLTLDVGMSAEALSWRPPDGDEIIFRGGNATGYGLYAIKPDGSGLRAITASDGVQTAEPGHGPGPAFDRADAGAYSLSPDGSLVAYQWHDGIGPQVLHVAPVDGGERRTITTAESWEPRWSPDGRWIAFFDGERTLNVVPADGSGPARRVADLPALPWLMWTPDSTRILVTPDHGNGPDIDTPLLIDPLGGPPLPAPWSERGATDWQRIAP